MKPQYYFYMVRFPGDSDYNLDWFRIFPTRNQANTFAKEIAAEKGWKFKYVSHESGKNYWDYEGTQTIVTIQTDEYYHGA